MYKLKIIATSTRPGRKSLIFSNWINGLAREFPAFETEILDLAVINLPFLDEPNHPIQRQYVHQHTRDWSAKIDEADAFIIVSPEYNYGFTGVFKNAMDYLHHEWKYKPVGILSYGGLAAGTRSAQMMKLVLTALSMSPLYEAVNIQFFTKHMDADGHFTPTEDHLKSARAMLASLVKWSEALRLLRTLQKDPA